jgi:hypothetical protein
MRTCVDARARGRALERAPTHAGATTTAVTETATAVRWPGQLTRERKQGSKASEAARGDDDDDTCKKLSQLGSMAGITSNVRDSAVADIAFPPRLEGRGIHK